MSKKGRPKASVAQVKAANNLQKNRVKIANIVARHPNLSRECRICGKSGKILHNRTSPYYITFICDECRKQYRESEQFKDKVNATRFNLKEYQIESNKYNKVSKLSDKEVTDTVREFIKNHTFISSFCEYSNISRYHFTKLLIRYNELYPEEYIYKKVSDKSSIGRKLSTKQKDV